MIYFLEFVESGKHEWDVKIQELEAIIKHGVGTGCLNLQIFASFWA